MMRFTRSGLLCGALLLVVVAQDLLASQSAPAKNGGKPSASSAVAPPAPPAGYVIGPEDVLGIVFWREPDMGGEATVRPDGRITLPVIGEIAAQGLTPEELKIRLEQAAAKYLSGPTVAVVVKQMNSQKVYITGQVTTPGSYALTGPRSVMQLIALAGGLTEFADKKSITIMRTENGKTSSFKFNYGDVSRGKKLEQNIMLRAGDTVVVP